MQESTVILIIPDISIALNQIKNIASVLQNK